MIGKLTWGLFEKAGDVAIELIEQGVEEAMGAFGKGNLNQLVKTFNGAVVIAKMAGKPCARLPTKLPKSSQRQTQPSTVFAAGGSCMDAYKEIKLVMEEASKFMDEEILLRLRLQKRNCWNTDLASGLLL